MKVKTKDLTDFQLVTAVLLALDLLSKKTLIQPHGKLLSRFIYVDSAGEGCPLVSAVAVFDFESGLEYSKMDSKEMLGLATAIIEDQKISMAFKSDSVNAKAFGCATQYSGPTHITAAMHCFVGMEFGDIVDLPDVIR